MMLYVIFLHNLLNTQISDEANWLQKSKEKPGAFTFLISHRYRSELLISTCILMMNYARSSLFPTIRKSEQTDLSQEEGMFSEIVLWF